MLLHQLSLASKYAGNSFILQDQCYVFSVLEGTILRDRVLLAFLFTVCIFIILAIISKIITYETITSMQLELGLRIVASNLR